jgi:hypothetical protein
MLDVVTYLDVEDAPDGARGGEDGVNVFEVAGNEADVRKGCESLGSGALGIPRQGENVEGVRGRGEAFDESGGLVACGSCDQDCFPFCRHVGILMDDLV